MKLSIIVAVYNTSKYIKQCLDTVLNQTMSPEDFEVIIVNDCSTDNSMEIIKSCVEGHDNVRIIDKPVNEATFWSRVDGIVAAKGDFIGFVDSDDWCAPDMYEVMVRKGISSDADIVQCGTIYEYEDGTSREYNDRVERKMTNLSMIEEYVSHPMQVALYLRVISRRVADEFIEKCYPFFNERREAYRGIRNEDDLLFPLFLAMAHNGIMYIEESFCHHRTEIEGSTMDIIRKNPKKFMDACVYRVSAGFDVLSFTIDQPEVYALLEHKQINVIFGLLGRLLQTDFYSKEEAGKLMKEAIKRFDSVKKYLPVKDRLRLLHLKIKTWYCYM